MDKPENNPDFHIPTEHRRPSQEYIEVVKRLLPRRWRISPPGHYWTQAFSPNPHWKMQGWKIHISSRLDTAVEILQVAGEICIVNNVEFKFTSDPYAHQTALSKTISRQAGGKFITIYPPTDAVFDQLLETLHSKLAQYDGPYILSDRQYKDSKVVFYRYGGFKSVDEINVYGITKSNILDDQFNAIEDRRLAKFHLPEFVVDRHASPLESQVQTKQDDGPALFGEHFEIISAIKYSNAGGVYLGRDVRADSTVIIKEARPHCEYGSSGLNAIGQLDSEYQILKAIDELDIGPRAIALFTEWDHKFLVQEKVPGKSLRQYIVSNSKIIHATSSSTEIGDWLHKTTTIAIRLLEKVARLHALGVVYGDISTNNVMIEEESLEVRLIDFETAFFEHAPSQLNIYTPGFGRRTRRSTDTTSKLDDQYALACVMLAMLTPSYVNNSLIDNFVEHALTFLSTDFKLPNEYSSCVRRLAGAELVDLDTCVAALREASFEQASSLPDSVVQLTPERAVSVRDRILSYTLKNMDVEHPWRVFPVDPEQRFQLSFDFGVIGTAYGLMRLQGGLAAELTDWLVKACRSEFPVPGLLNGAAGAAWLFLEANRLDEAKRLLRHLGHHRLLFTNSSLGYGCSGYGLAQLKAWLATGDDAHLQEARHIADALCESAEVTADGLCWDRTSNGTVQLGLHRGSCGIALFLTYMHAATRHAEYLNVAKAAFSFDASFGKRIQGVLGFPGQYTTGQTGSGILYPYLGAGTAGMITTALRLFKLTGVDEYLNFVEEAKTAVAQKYSISAGLNNGLAGLANCLLDAAQFTGKEDYRTRAWRAADGLLLFSADRPEGTAFPAMRAGKISCSFGSGSMGIALLLDRLVLDKPSFGFTLDELLQLPCAVSD